MTASVDAVLERMCKRGVATRADLRGCTAEEVAALEKRFGVALPAAYRRYLAVMGHASGRLFTHDHVEAAYDDVIRCTAENAEPPLAEAEPRVPLGPNGLIRQSLKLHSFRLCLIILSRMGEQFLFIRCDGGEDAVVLHFASGPGGDAKPSHPSIGAWLEAWCEEAEEAIASGYYERRARGRW